MKRCTSCAIARHLCIGGIPQYSGAIIEKANAVPSTGSGSSSKARTVKATVSAADATGLPEGTSVFDVKGSRIGFVGWLKEEVFVEKGIKKRSAILQGVEGEVLETKLTRTSSSSLRPISSVPSSSSSHLPPTRNQLRVFHLFLSPLRSLNPASMTSFFAFLILSTCQSSAAIWTKHAHVFTMLMSIIKHPSECSIDSRIAGYVGGGFFFVLWANCKKNVCKIV